MKMSRLGGGLSIGLLICAACEVRTGPGAFEPSSGNRGGGARATGGAAANAPAPAPAPMPHVPPTPTPTPSPQGNTPTHSSASPSAHQVPNLRRMAIRSVAPPPATNAGVSYNASSTAKYRGRLKSVCGPREVAPGVIVTIDCTKQYATVQKAKFVNISRRLKLFKNGTLKGDQGAVGGGAPPAVGDSDVPRELPALVDHRADGTEGPVKNQGRVGSCTGFSLSTALDNGIRRLNKADVSSSMHIWAHYGYPDMSAAGDSNFQRPIAAWPDWTYNEALACRMYKGPGVFSCGDQFNPGVQQASADSDPAVQTQIKDTDGKGKYKITSIEKIFARPVDGDALAAQLASGKDIWAAFGVKGDDAWFSPANGEIPDYDEAESGHAVVIAGYRMKDGARQFLIHNSWSERWGDKGYAWISEKMVKQHLKDAYVLKVEDMSAPPPPPPPPPPKPNGDCAQGFARVGDNSTCLKVCGGQGDCDAASTCSASGGSGQVCVANNAFTDDDCADDELVDSVTGKCATICGNDSRPANGACNAIGGCPGGCGKKMPPGPPSHR